MTGLKSSKIMTKLKFLNGRLILGFYPLIGVNLIAVATEEEEKDSFFSLCFGIGLDYERS